MEDIAAMVDNLAKLSRLDLREEEKYHLGAQLSVILEAASKVQHLDTTGVEPALHVVHSLENLRKDRVFDSSAGEELLFSAPDREGNYFKVPSLFLRFRNEK